MTLLKAFSRAWYRLHVLTSISDWFITPFASVVIGHSNCFGLSFATLSENCSKKSGFDFGVGVLCCNLLKPLAQLIISASFIVCRSCWQMLTAQTNELNKLSRQRGYAKFFCSFVLFCLLCVCFFVSSFPPKNSFRRNKKLQVLVKMNLKF